MVQDEPRERSRGGGQDRCGDGRRDEQEDDRLAGQGVTTALVVVAEVVAQERLDDAEADDDAGEDDAAESSSTTP